MQSKQFDMVAENSKQGKPSATLYLKQAAEDDNALVFEPQASNSKNIQGQESIEQDNIDEETGLAEKHKPYAVLHLKHQQPFVTEADIATEFSKEILASGISGKKLGWRSGTGQREELAKKTEEVASPQPSKSKMGQEIVAHKPVAMLHLKSQASSELPEAADLASLPLVTAGKKGEKKEKHGVTLDTQPYTGQLSELSRLDGHQTQSCEGLVQPYHSGQSWQAVNKQEMDITIPASKTVAVLHLRQPSQPTENKESITSSLTEVKKHVRRQVMATQHTLASWVVCKRLER
uniref:Uncharacterized protein n=1 Tax=Ditylenchus dipsaci TaxID=166011 RepID=A0A915EN77_9BILA